ncbi:hypothetical protein SAMN04487948_10643 [Halogranum amylolyticum]|uniref:Uncharacterized protein n=1 Tax=Halogranum amylolyticum TaxID=660520 RepID=A0A1H8T7T0_9EURY|nr:DUF5805 domain-containing protein [Halogranum amylolyticum]SEO86523.1 hypothetical protein SAMN04487948_10643 [Halogranum amylolyticum]
MSDDPETSRTAVRTYVPAYQKERWQKHAEELDMSQSEFVRTMVQAGRKGFELDPEDTGSGHETPGVDGLETRVLSTLESTDFMSWDQLVEALAGDLEDRLDDALGELQGSNRIRYSGRHGGYTLVSDGD